MYKEGSSYLRDSTAQSSTKSSTAHSVHCNETQIKPQVCEQFCQLSHYSQSQLALTGQYFKFLSSLQVI